MWRSGALGLQLLVGYVIGACAGSIFAALARAARGSFAHIALVFAAGVAGAAGGLIRWWRAGRPVQSDAHGSAAFGDPQRAKASLGGDGLIVGRAPAGWLMRYAGPAHLMTIAPTRSGKGVGAIIPNLLTADRAILCVDPKGENARMACAARQAFGPVHVLDPFGVSGAPSAAFNPLEALDAASLDVAEDAAAIAEALVYDPPEQVSEAHWNEEAKALITGLILHAVASPYPARRTLGHVRGLLTLSAPDLPAELRAMQASDAAGGLVARAANRHLAKADREAAGVLSAAQRHTHFLDSPRMSALLSRSDFRLEHLRSERATLFLVLPPDRLATHARWLRLMVSQALDTLARTPAGRSAPPVLFLLDEFAALGRLEPIARAFGLMAGYGVQLWPFLQDLHQLRGAYGRHADTFLANAGLLQVFNVADLETANWVSRTLGPTTEAYLSHGWSRSHAPNQLFATHSDSSTLNLVRRDLLTPDEVMRLAADRLLLLRPGERPLLARKVRYFADREFRGLASPAAAADPPQALPRLDPQAMHRP